jgi:ATP/maltotriose-dependent transcriptional regulator MalT
LDRPSRASRATWASWAVSGWPGDGHTNTEIGGRLFISGRTVEWHLHKIFAKLGISCRNELRDALPELGQLALPA